MILILGIFQSRVRDDFIAQLHQLVIININMNIQQVIKNQQLKKKLQAKREQRIKKKLVARQREKANLDFSHLKTGKMEKTKIIQKKVFQTQVQKARKIQVTIQDNANSSTFVGESQEYLTILARTKNYIKFDKNKLIEGCKAISGYAAAHKEKYITLQLTMENPIQCHETPALLRLPYPNAGNSCVILTRNLEGTQQNIVKDADIRVLGLKQFAQKYKKDVAFKKQVNKKTMRVFCDFNIFCKSKLVKKLLNQHVVVFPIDTKKVPFSLKEEIPTYHDYIRLLLQSEFFTTKSGNQHRVRLENRESCEELAGNVESLTWQAVARLIQKNKQKGNKLRSARIKTETSIPIDIYN